jgi:hypothetical protein
MKIFHLSDTHGWGFWDRPLPPDADVVDADFKEVNDKK